jgi:hypothetical protein
MGGSGGGTPILGGVNAPAAYDFSVSGLDIITQAYREIGYKGPEDSLEGWEIQDGLLKLNLLVKSWMGPNNPIAKGLKVWQRARGVLVLSAKNSFSLQPGGDLDIPVPVNLISATLKTSAGIVVTTLDPILAIQYEMIPNKSAVGTPMQYYFERGIGASSFGLDCIPSDLTMTINLLYLRILQDFDGQTDVPDFPQEWYRTLVYNLAMELAPMCGRPISQDLQSLAQSSFADANTVEPERTVFFFEPGRDY